MRHLIFTTALTMALSTQIGHAAPYCEALLDAEMLPKKYKKNAPIYSDSVDGWIVANDQLAVDFEFGDDARFLMGEIAGAFKARNINLVLAVAPPRPLFLDTAIDGYDKATAAAGFKSYLDAISATGVFAPDLYTAMTAALGQDAYFERDTHWTPKGAAYSAFNLVHQMGGLEKFEQVFADLKFDDPYLEKGSLTAVVNQVCKTELAPETVMSATFTKQGTATDLLSDGASNTPKIALAGTSFSNRYSRDVYRFSDALAFAFKADVENYSVSGGGIVSALETLILSDAFQNGTYKTVIWEVPYTQNLSDTHSLRQILGALRANTTQGDELFSGTVGDDWQSVALSLTASGDSILQITTDSADQNRIDVEFYNKAKEKTRLKLVKSSRIPGNLQTDIWSASLAGLDVTGFNKMKIRLNGAASNQPLSASLIQ